MKSNLALIPLLVCLPLLALACTTENHTYRPPSGVGPILYSEDRGIHRAGDEIERDVELMWYQAKIAFEKGEWAAARNALREFRFDPKIVDSPRALDAILLESVVALESGRRSEDDLRWRLHDLANAWLDNDVSSDALRYIPASILSADGLTELRGLAGRLTDGGYVQSAFDIQQIIFEHYTYGLGIVPSRITELSRQMRNLAWFAYVGEDYSLAIKIARALLERSPRIEVRSSTQLVLAQSYIKNDRARQAVDVYHDVFITARDPDIKEEALLGEVQAQVASSKGWTYNSEPYELALEKITEYKTGFLTVYRDAKLVREFSEVERQIHDILYKKDKEAATVYKRLFEGESSQFYHRVAARRRDTQTKAEETLRKVYREDDAEKGDG